MVIPAYNEASRLPGTLREIHAFLVDSNYDAEIIVVNDGSTDQTSFVVHEVSKSLPLVQLVEHASNHGKGWAVRSGVLVARKEAILLLDADQSTPISELDRFWRAYDQGFKVIIGSRARSESRIVIAQPRVRRLLGSLFRFLVSLLAIRGIRDSQCGFKLFNAESAKLIFPKLRTRGFAFDVEVLLRARRQGIKVFEQGVLWRDDPDSRVHPLRDGLAMLFEILGMRGILL